MPCSLESPRGIYWKSCLVGRTLYITNGRWDRIVFVLRGYHCIRVVGFIIFSRHAISLIIWIVLKLFCNWRTFIELESRLHMENKKSIMVTSFANLLSQIVQCTCTYMNVRLFSDIFGLMCKVQESVFALLLGRYIACEVRGVGEKP